jgi:sterol desaturase/sphingolipid hydroxylase (fatty acid hydroxylase superfamily)
MKKAQPKIPIMTAFNTFMPVAYFLFYNSNIQISISIDNILRKIIITPDLHRVHHSIHSNECNSNYGFNLSLWEKILKTYIEQPKDGHRNMEIGLKEIQGDDAINFKHLMTMPFTSK